MRTDSKPITSPTKLFFAFLLLAAGLACTRAGEASGRSNPYQVAVTVPDRSQASREAGFRAAMNIVAVRATGNRAAATDPALAPLVGDAGRYVQEYRYAPDGRLWVGFDGAAIERWLAQNGAPVWGRTRPLTFVWLIAQTGPAAGSVVTTDDTSDLKAAIDAEASARGIDLEWPTASDLQAYRLDYTAVAQANPATLAAIAAKLGAEGVLIGRTTALTAQAGVSWLQVFHSQSGAIVGAAAGVDLAADAYASMFAVSGVAAPVRIEVDGIGNVRDYAQVQRYLESLTIVSHMAVLGLSADTADFLLDARGGAMPLERTLTLNGPLERDTTDGAGGVLRFHLRH